MIRSVREAAVIALIGGVAAAVVWSCSPGPVLRGGEGSCDRLDSLYASSGFERPVEISGQAMVDANQYKVRGKIHLSVRSPGEVVLEFTSTVLFGHAREDIVFSLVGDTLRIVDRERGAYYEASEAESVLAESLGTDLDVRPVLSLVLGARPPCDELTEVEFEAKPGGQMLCKGKHMGEDFRALFGAGRRLEEIEWSVRSDTRGPDRLRAAYDWGADSSGVVVLRGLEITLETREWRCRVRSAG